MIRISKIFLLTMAMISSFGQLDAYIIEICGLKKQNTIKKGPQWIIGLSDLHDKNHPKSMHQKREILQFLLQLPKRESKILIEDLSSPSVHGNKTCGKFYIKVNGGVLSGFSQECRMHNLPVENHEFRFCRVSALSPLLKQVKEASSIASKIKVSSIYDEIKRSIERVNSFNIAPNSLQKKFQSIVLDVKKKLKALEIVPSNNVSIQEYIETHIPLEKRADFIKNLLVFDSELLDFQLMEAALNAQGKKYVIIIAGGAHIKRIFTMLKNHGYAVHYQEKAKKVFSSDRNCCAGQPFVNDVCFAPRAVELSSSLYKTYKKNTDL